MNKLFKHQMETELVWPFIQDNLDGANALSIELLNIVKQKEGHFFTLLPKGAHLENIYQCKHGNILPQNPIKYGPVANLGNYHYKETPSISDEVANIIVDLLQKDANLSCIVDDVIRYSTDKLLEQGSEEIKNCIAYSGRDVYYLLNKRNATIPLVSECLRRNRGYWHALSIISKISLKGFTGKELKKPILTQICNNAQMLIIGAYDGEGYIFWECA